MANNRLIWHEQKTQYIDLFLLETTTTTQSSQDIKIDFLATEVDQGICRCTGGGRIRGC